MISASHRGVRCFSRFLFRCKGWQSLFFSLYSVGSRISRSRGMSIALRQFSVSAYVRIVSAISLVKERPGKFVTRRLGIILSCWRVRRVGSFAMGCSRDSYGHLAIFSPYCRRDCTRVILCRMVYFACESGVRWTSEWMILG